MCAIVEKSLEGIRQQLDALRAFLGEQETYKEWKEYRREHPHQPEEVPGARGG